ncbi:S-layer homology domain-containing protein [Neobacillus drentensis]
MVTAAEAGLIKGNGDGKFNPNAYFLSFNARLRE